MGEPFHNFERDGDYVAPEPRHVCRNCRWWHPLNPGDDPLEFVDGAELSRDGEWGVCVPVGRLGPCAGDVRLTRSRDGLPDARWACFERSEWAGD